MYLFLETFKIFIIIFSSVMSHHVGILLCGLQWPETHCVVDLGLEFIAIFLSQPPESWNYRCNVYVCDVCICMWHVCVYLCKCVWAHVDARGQSLMLFLTFHPSCLFERRSSAWIGIGDLG